MRDRYRPVSAMTTADADPAFIDVFGLPAAMQYFFGSLRSADGRYFWPIRGSYRDRARHLHLSEGKFTGPTDMPTAVSDFTFAVEAAGAHERAASWVSTAPGSWAINRTDGRPPLVATDNTSLTWIEDDKLALHGMQRGVGVQFRVPNTEWPFMYSSRLFEVDSGQIDGCAVKGWVFHDTLCPLVRTS